MDKSRKLNVLMNGVLVGVFEKSTKFGFSFTYDTNWLSEKNARPISLSLPLVKKAFTGDVVYNFFDNLLPDNQQIRARIQTRFQTKTGQPFDLLEKIGRDCAGAIQILDTPPKKLVKEILYEPLSDNEIAATLKAYQNAPLGMSDSMGDFRISIAGAQEKSAFLYHDKKWCRPIGATPTTHIFKLPIGIIPQQQLDLRDSCENEWLCSQIVAAFGLAVANCHIEYFKDVKVLVVERFDRKLSKDGSWLMRLPQEDICQALACSPNLKYQADGGPGIKDIMYLLLGSQRPQKDRDAFFRSQVVFWCLAAIDGHAKNFSVLIGPEGRYRLTPLYDIMSSYPLIAKKELHGKKIKMAMALRGKNNHYHWHNIQRRHFLDTAKVVDYSHERAETIVNKVMQQIESVIDLVSSKLPDDFPEEISQPIFDGMLNFKNKM